MILYSIIPAEIVFGDYFRQEQNDGTKRSESKEFFYLGERVEVSPLTEDQYVIRRLISTSPKAFLDPRFKPGTIIARH